MSFQTPLTIKKALERIDKRELLLPAIQREFVWSADDIELLFDSLMCDFPINSFLFWKVPPTACCCLKIINCSFVNRKCCSGKQIAIPRTAHHGAALSRQCFRQFIIITDANYICLGIMSENKSR